MVEMSVFCERNNDTVATRDVVERAAEVVGADGRVSRP
jgi:hypothetical protein